MRSLHRISFQALLAFGVIGAAPASIIYSSDFGSGNTVGWSTYTIDGSPISSPSDDANPIQTDLTPAGNRPFLGQFGTQLVRLSLNDVPVGSPLAVTAQLFVINSWDGNCSINSSGPDRFTVGYRGVETLLDTSFSNNYWAPDVYAQSYPGAFLTGSFAPQTGASEKGTLGYASPDHGNLDSVYNLQFSITPVASSVDLEFVGRLIDQGPGGTSPLFNESWGLGRVQVQSAPEPTSIVVLGMGALALLRKRTSRKV